MTHEQNSERRTSMRRLVVKLVLFLEAAMSPRLPTCHTLSYFLDEGGWSWLLGTTLSLLSSSTFQESSSYAQNGFRAAAFLQQGAAMTSCTKSSYNWLTSPSALGSLQVLSSLEKASDCPVVCSPTYTLARTLVKKARLGLSMSIVGVLKHYLLHLPEFPLPHTHRDRISLSWHSLF